MPDRGTIVAAFARTDEGEAALRIAIEEARRHDARLVVVHSSRGGTREDEAQVVSDQERLDKIKAELAAAGIESEVTYRVQGNAPEADVLAVAKERSAQLLVIGLRRRTPVGKALFGSTAQQVLLRAPCPVLAVPADFDATSTGWA